MRIGTRNRHAEIKQAAGRYPTLRGENPPQGIAWRGVELWLWPSRRCFTVRWWTW